MKKITFLLSTFLLLYSLTVLPTLAVTSTPSSTAKEATSPGKNIRQELATKAAERQEQVKELRERLATRVAELREKMRRAWAGEIKSITGTTIVLTTRDGEKTVLTNEETSFFRLGVGARKKITLADLDVGEKITAFGQMEQESGKMTAKIIIAKVLPVNINGKVINVDVEGGTITVQTVKRGSMVVDVETTTKILVWERGKGLQKSGLSKIKVGDRVHVNGISNSRTVPITRITANRILVLPGQAIGILGSPRPSASPSALPVASPTASPE